MRGWGGKLKFIGTYNVPGTMLGDICTYLILKQPLKFHLLIIPILQTNKGSHRKTKSQKPKVFPREDCVIPKPMLFLLYHYNVMIICSIKCDFLLALLAARPPDQTTNKTILTQICAIRGLLQRGLWNSVLVRGHALLVPFTFYFLSH